MLRVLQVYFRTCNAKIVCYMLEKLQLQKVDGGATNREKLRFEAPG
mgnify:CR=1 FL=1